MQKLQCIDHLQLNVLEHYYSTKELQRRERLMQTIDDLNKRYGNGTVNWAACVPTQEWAMRREHLSCATTTQIDRIPIVHS